MTTSTPPLVGIPACIRDIRDLPFHTVNQRYLMALTEVSGCLPLIIPALDHEHDVEALIPRLDGLLLTGSPSDVEPHHYGRQNCVPEAQRDPARDATALSMIRAAVKQDVPLFAICRGIQELNVAMGGTLHQQVHALPNKRDHRSDKTKPREERYDPVHEVSLDPGGVLAGLAGAETVMVNSLHGQGIEEVGEGLAVEAVAPDGLIEAVRVESASRFGLGVQWHPEAIYHRNALSHALFSAFGDATHAFAQSRGKTGSPSRAA
jgi:putative glutamine amidotransferase